MRLRRRTQLGPGGVPRAVLDTNVLVSGLISPSGPSAQLLIELHSGAFELVVSPTLLAELSDVLRRPKLRRHVSEPEAVAFVDYIRTASIVIDDPKPPARPSTADPGDEYLIVLAAAAKVDALVSGDAHLLDLRDELPVLTPREFLESLAD